MDTNQHITYCITLRGLLDRRGGDRWYHEHMHRASANAAPLDFSIHEDLKPSLCGSLREVGMQLIQETHDLEEPPLGLSCGAVSHGELSVNQQKQVLRVRMCILTYAL